VDGKTLRGSRDADGQQTKLVCVYDHAHQLVLTQTAVVAGDEVAAFTAALATLPDLRNVLVTADALHCQRAHATFLAARGGHYLFTVKSNQPLLRQELGRLPGRRRPALGAAAPNTGAPSLARLRPSTWTAPLPAACSHTPAGRSRSSDGAASVPADPR
jgi:Transposase DDE domain